MTNIVESSFAGAIKTKFEPRLLMSALAKLVHGRWGVKATLNQYGVNEWRRYSALSAITSALTEATTPTEQTAPTLTQVTATPLHYGSWIGYSDEMLAKSFDPVVSWVAGVLGRQAGLSVDTLRRNEITDGATKLYSNSKASRAVLDAPDDNLNFKDILRAIATLQANDAEGASSGRYPVIAHPDSWATLMMDPTFNNLFVHGSPATDQNPLRSGFVGTLLNCDFYVTSNAREYADGGAGDTDAYSLVFIGNESYGIAGIQGMFASEVDASGPGYSNNTGAGQEISPVKLILKSPGSAGADDPLDQRGSVGWKLAEDSEILNILFLVDLEHTTIRSDE